MAVRWLVSVCIDGVSWTSKAPYGGEGDLKSREYPTAVVVRALLAAVSLDDPDYQATIADHRALTATKRAKRQRRWLMVAVAALLIAIGTRFDEIAWDQVQTLFQGHASGLLTTVGVVGGVPLALLGLYASVYPDDARYAWQRMQRRVRNSFARLRA
jgi:hypothetical protein